MVGLPGRRFLGPGWQARHRALIENTMRSQVRVIRLADQQGTRDPVAGRTAFAVPYVVYEGPARVQSRSAGTSTPVANRFVTVGSYLVACPTDSTIAVIGDLVEVLSCPDSPMLNGLVLKIVDVPAADIAWQRSYGCDLHTPTARG